MAKNKSITRQDMLDELSDSISSYDTGTLIAIAQDSEGKRWSKMADHEIESEYNSYIVGASNEDEKHYVPMLDRTKAGKILFKEKS